MKLLQLKLYTFMLLKYRPISIYYIFMRARDLWFKFILFSDTRYTSTLVGIVLKQVYLQKYFR